MPYKTAEIFLRRLLFKSLTIILLARTGLPCFPYDHDANVIVLKIQRI